MIIRREASRRFVIMIEKQPYKASSLKGMTRRGIGLLLKLGGYLFTVRRRATGNVLVRIWRKRLSPLVDIFNKTCARRLNMTEKEARRRNWDILLKKNRRRRFNRLV